MWIPVGFPLRETHNHVGIARGLFGGNFRANVSEMSAGTMAADFKHATPPADRLGAVAV